MRKKFKSTLHTQMQVISGGQGEPAPMLVWLPFFYRGILIVAILSPKNVRLEMKLRDPDLVYA
jgi:hypothetical protein